MYTSFYKNFSYLNTKLKLILSVLCVIIIGSACNTPFMLHKFWVHEAGIVIPLVVHWPAVIKDGGSFRTMPSHIVDITPTLLKLAGGSREEITDSIKF